MYFQDDDIWILFSTTCRLMGPHKSKYLSPEPTVMLGFTIFFSFFYTDIAATVSQAQWHNGPILSDVFHPETVKNPMSNMDHWSLISWQKQSRNASSQPGQVLTPTAQLERFQTGPPNQGNPLSCQLSQRAGKVPYISHLSNFIAKPCSFP